MAMRHNESWTVEGLAAQARFSLTPVVAAARNASIVLIGDASHGTQEHYEGRASITRHLIEAGHVTAVVLECSPSLATSINHYTGATTASPDETLNETPSAVLQGDDWPEWKWNNISVVGFLKFLRSYNAECHDDSRKVMVIGMEPKNPRASCEVVLAYARGQNAEKYTELVECYRPIMSYADPVKYGKACAWGELSDRAEEIRVNLKRATSLVFSLRSFDRLSPFSEKTWDGKEWTERSSREQWQAELNAKAIVAADEFYSTLVDHELGKVAAWDFRECFFADVLREVAQRLEGKQVCWTHNSHLGGDGLEGNVTLGGILHEERGEHVFRIGFETHHGAVRAAISVGKGSEVFALPPARSGSLGSLMHEIWHRKRCGEEGEEGQFCSLLCRDLPPMEMLQRSVGTIYNAEEEDECHYVKCRPSEVYDAIVHCDRTSAVEVDSYT